MIIPEEFQDQDNGMVFCHASITAEFMVEFADDYFYNFVGRLYGIRFTELLHPDYVSEFTDVIAQLKIGDRVRLFLPVLGGDEKYHMVDVHAFKTNEMKYDQPLVDIRLWSIMSMEYRYKALYDNNNKYRSFLSMYNDYLFDYDFETDTFTIFNYDSIKPNILIKDTFENAKNRIVAVIDDSDSKKRFLEFMDKVGDCNEGFNFEFLAPTFTDLNKTVNYHVSCHIMYKHNRQKLAIGVLRYDDYESDIAYYQRPESKDFFTGVYNKKACQLLVNDTIAINKSKHYMIMMDVDNFKNINDNYGHLVGDQVILKMAEIINKTVAGRGFVGRFGGDEFFIFTSAISSEETLRSMLGYLKKMMVKEFQEEFGEGGLTCSMGVALYPDNADNYTDLFNIADKCLYMAKEKGKNRFIIYDREKHGPVNEEDSESSGVTEVQKSGQEMAENMSQLLLNIPSQEADIVRFLSEAASVLGVDAIRTYVGPDSQKCFVSGEYKNIDVVNETAFGDNMTKLYKDLAYSPVSVLSNIQSLAPDVYLACENAGIGGFFSCRHKTRSDNEVRVFFDNIGRKSNCTQSQREFMILFTGIIASLF